MKRPEDISEKVWNEARLAWSYTTSQDPRDIEIVARTLLKSREEAFEEAWKVVNNLRAKTTFGTEHGRHRAGALQDALSAIRLHSQKGEK